MFKKSVEILNEEVNTFYIVKWVSCHHGIAHRLVVDGGDGPQIYREYVQQAVADN
jgi:hypothetical protein